MKRAFLLDVVIGKGATIIELFSSENQTLLIRRNSFLVLNLALDIFNSIRRLDLEGDCLSGERLDEYLHYIGLVLVFKPNI